MADLTALIKHLRARAAEEEGRDVELAMFYWDCADEVEAWAPAMTADSNAAAVRQVDG